MRIAQLAATGKGEGSEEITLFAPRLSRYVESSSFAFLDKEIFSDLTSGDVRYVDLLVKAKCKNQDSYQLSCELQ